MIRLAVRGRDLQPVTGLFGDPEGVKARAMPCCMQAACHPAPIAARQDRGKAAMSTARHPAAG
jgi:hypothetical protein